VPEPQDRLLPRWWERTAGRSLTDAVGAGHADLELQDGDRVAVIGGGPAGSFFTYFLLKIAGMVDLHLNVDIYEPRAFTRSGPGGCNHCGGIVSESLVQILAAEGIKLPPGVIQSGIQSYVVHMDVGSVDIASPARESRIAALYRANGPRGGEALAGISFDGYLQELAVEKGARIVRKLVTGLEWRDGYPWVREADGTETRYDLVTVASGVNSMFLRSIEGFPTPPDRPKTTRTYICELKSTREEIDRVLGPSMHVFLLDIPRLEFAALIPKGEYVTLVMLGDDLDPDLVHAFMESPVVRPVLPSDVTLAACACNPLINMGGMKRPYADRLLLIGDSGVTRLYKDGIGAAFRTAKAAAMTAVLQGVSAKAFARDYWPSCRSIARDNAIGRLIFLTTTILKKLRFSRRAILRMTTREQSEAGRTPRMSAVLWNMFTGSAPYREILTDTLRPGFLGNFAVNLATALWPAGGRMKGG
jgi:flavin-dependent dehydrogenase